MIVPIDDEPMLEATAAATRALASRAAALDPDLATVEFVMEHRGGPSRRTFPTRSSRKATPSRLLGSRPCTKASGGPASSGSQVLKRPYR